MKPCTVFLNWKMYLDYGESVALGARLSKMSVPSDAEVAVFPSTLALVGVHETLTGTAIALGAQNASWVPRGAYTGAVSPHMLADVGCQYILLGHSERRHVFGESDTDIRKKVEAALDAGVTPVVCIGETAEEKESGQREYRLKKQLMSIFAGLPPLTDRSIVVAYEPVWAIGSGTACLPEDANDIHTFISEEIRQYTASAIPLLYGGSVSAENVVSYVSCEMVDGVLVGTAGSTEEGVRALFLALGSA